MKATRGELLTVTLLLIGSLVFVWGCLVIGQNREADRLTDSGTIPPVEITCQEDMPCWDCSTMGNRECGPNRK